MCQGSCKACMCSWAEKGESLCRRLFLSATIHRTHCSCRNLAGPKRHLWPVSTRALYQSRVENSNSYDSSGWAQPKPRKDGAAQPAPAPPGSPPNPEPRPTYLGGVRAACSPSSRNGDGVPGGNSWLSLPDCLQALRKVPLLPAGCCSLDEVGRGKKTRQGWAQQNQQPEAGTHCPGRTRLVQASSSGRSGRKGLEMAAQGFWLAFRLCCNLCYFQRARDT